MQHAVGRQECNFPDYKNVSTLGHLGIHQQKGLPYVLDCVKSGLELEPGGAFCSRIIELPQVSWKIQRQL